MAKAANKAAATTKSKTVAAAVKKATKKQVKKAKPVKVKPVKAPKLSKANEILVAFDAVRGTPDEVMVALKKEPNKPIGFIECIEGEEVLEGEVECIESYTVTVNRVEAGAIVTGSYELPITDLVLFAQPKKVKKAELGTAAEQHAAYAERAQDYHDGDLVVELNGKGREGVVSGAPTARSAYLNVEFYGVLESKHVADLSQITTVAPKEDGADKTVNTDEHTWAVPGAIVQHTSGQQGVVINKVGTLLFTELDDGSTEHWSINEVSEVTVAESLNSTSVPAVKQKKVAFSEIQVFAPFVGGGVKYVKVGNSTAIAADVRGTADEAFAMLATSGAKVKKVRFRQKDKVEHFAGEQLVNDVQ